MPMQFKIFRDLDLLVARPTGVVTQDCLFAYFDALRRSPDWRPGLNRIIDNRQTLDVDLTFAEMRNIRANEKPPPAGKTLTTVFIAESDLAFGMARVYAASEPAQGGGEVRIVETLAEALPILGIDPKYLADLRSDEGWS